MLAHDVPKLLNGTLSTLAHLLLVMSVDVIPLSVKLFGDPHWFYDVVSATLSRIPRVCLSCTCTSVSCALYRFRSTFCWPVAPFSVDVIPLSAKLFGELHWFCDGVSATLRRIPRLFLPCTCTSVSGVELRVTFHLLQARCIIVAMSLLCSVTSGCSSWSAVFLKMFCVLPTSLHYFPLISTKGFRLVPVCTLWLHDWR